MTQPSVAFITGRALSGEQLKAALLEQAERFVLLGRCNLVVIVDTFQDLEGAAIPAIAALLGRAAELKAELTCVAHDERVVALLRAHPALKSMRVIQRVDQIRAA